MFGYIKPYPANLLVKEYQLYKAAYCGLCRTSGKHVSVFSRFLLNYDFVLLALVRMALTGEKVETEMRRCKFNGKRKNVMKPNGALEYTAYAFALLSYYKLKDDINDKHGIKKLPFILAKPFFARMRKKALPKVSELDSDIASLLDGLSATEKGTEAVPVDAAAHSFAALTEKIATFGLEGETKRIASVIGYQIGRYIYIADAVDDIHSDEKENNYNPFLKLYGTAERSWEHCEAALSSLDTGMNAASLAFMLAEPSMLEGLIQNILLEGSTETVKNIRKKNAPEKKGENE